MKDELVKYKIHGISTLKKGRTSANNNVFYDTRQEAIEQARKYLQDPRNSECEGFVILKTCSVVRPATAPVKVYDVDDYDQLRRRDWR